MAARATPTVMRCVGETKGCGWGGVGWVVAGRVSGGGDGDDDDDEDAVKTKALCAVSVSRV